MIKRRQQNCNQRKGIIKNIITDTTIGCESMVTVHVNYLFIHFNQGYDDDKQTFVISLESLRLRFH